MQVAFSKLQAVLYKNDSSIIKLNFLTKWLNGRPCKIHHVQSLYSRSGRFDLQCLATCADADFCKNSHTDYSTGESKLVTTG